MQFLFVCMSVCMSICHLRDMPHKVHVTVAAHHIRKVSQWQLVGQKTRTLMPCNCQEGSLRNKNTHQIRCVKKLRMAQAQSFRAHNPGGFKFGEAGVVQQKLGISCASLVSPPFCTPPGPWRPGVTRLLSKLNVLSMSVRTRSTCLKCLFC